MSRKEDPTRKAEKEFMRGTKSARKAMSEGGDPLAMLNDAKSSLTEDAFDEGWKSACRGRLREIADAHNVGPKKLNE